MTRTHGKPGKTVTAVVHAAEEGGYWAEVPELPGCLTQGETLDELRDNLNDAVEAWLEAAEATGYSGSTGDRVVALMPIDISSA